MGGVRVGGWVLYGFVVISEQRQNPYREIVREAFKTLTEIL